jgi:hypothetical protein
MPAREPITKAARPSLVPIHYSSLEPRQRTLMDMLTYKRPHGSKSEAKFINRFIRPLGVTEDQYGNLYKRIGTAPVLWSSHTDSVHRQAGRQVVEMDAQGFISAPLSSCLGADCAAGVWLMCEMIRAGREGLYVFHREEESGGQGATWIAKHRQDLLKGIKYAIAFDRKGVTSVITHQWGSRCCSEAFAASLIGELGTGWKTDDGGTFTDTAIYVDLIGECTNISVGYYDQHTSLEKQHLPFITALLDRLLILDVSKLVSARKPGEVETDDWRAYAYSTKGDTDEASVTYTRKAADRSYSPNDDDDGVYYRSSKRTSHARLLEAIADHTDVVASILEDYGIGADEILDAVYGAYNSKLPF